MHSYLITTDNQISLCATLGVEALATLLDTTPDQLGGSALLNGEGYLIWGPGNGNADNQIGMAIRHHCTVNGDPWLFGDVVLVSNAHFEKLGLNSNLMMSF